MICGLDSDLHWLREIDNIIFSYVTENFFIRLRSFFQKQFLHSNEPVDRDRNFIHLVLGKIGVVSKHSLILFYLGKKLY